MCNPSAARAPQRNAALVRKVPHGWHHECFGTTGRQRGSEDAGTSVIRLDLLLQFLLDERR
jgi:hypothetical protein